MRTAWNSIFANKLRAGLTALGVVIGVASVIATLALGNGAQAAVQASFRALGSNQIQINQKMTYGQNNASTAAYKPLTYEDGLGMLQAVPRITNASMSVNTSATVRFGRNSEDGINVVGSTADALSKLVSSAPIQPRSWAGGRDLTAQDFMGEGRFFSPAEVQANSPVCIIGYQTAQDLFEGDDPIGLSLWIGRRTFQVIGVLADLEPTDPTNYSADQVNKQIFLPIGTAINDLFTTAPDVNIIATVKNENQIPQAEKEITSYLRQRHNIAPDSQGVHNDDFTLTTQNDILGAQQAAANTFALLLAAMAAIALTVGGIGIMNVMLISVSERTREIGVRLAVGARQRDIIAQFLLEAVILSAASGLIGIVIGILAIPLAATLNQGQAVLAPGSIPLSFAVALLTGIVFGIYPAVRAAQLDPIEALGYE
jgi:putative ABC transport system permease protein